MILHCPECDATIKAANINVQELAAVCQECDAVFNFDMADVGGKQKRRKYKAPAKLVEVEEDDRLTMRYRRVYSEDEQGFATGNGFFTVLLPIFTLIVYVSGVPLWLVIFFVLWTLVSWYAQAALLLNTTSIVLDDEFLRVSKGPLPWVTGATSSVFDRVSVLDVTTTETSASRQGSGIKRFYHIRVQQPDGDSITILPGMPQAYARYIRQELNAELERAEDEADYARLTDIDDIPPEDILSDAGDAPVSDDLPGFLND